MAHPETVVEVQVFPGSNGVEEGLHILGRLGAACMELQEDWADGVPRLLGGFERATPDQVGQRMLGLLQGTRGIMAAHVRAARTLDWSDTWEGDERALQVGPVWIVPPKRKAPAGAKHVLRLQSNRSFGSGAHPTTTLCLRLLADLPAQDSFLDVGTGTGILALCALELGWNHAVATDNDPQALAEARANAAANRMDTRLELSPLGPRALGRQFQLVMANILTAPLVEMAQELAYAVGPGGLLVLSGVRDTQVKDVTRAFVWHGLRAGPQEQDGNWVRLEFRPPW